jgi:hypothetical protein
MLKQYFSEDTKEELSALMNKPKRMKNFDWIVKWFIYKLKTPPHHVVRGNQNVWNTYDVNVNR